MSVMLGGKSGSDSSSSDRSFRVLALSNEIEGLVVPANPLGIRRDDGTIQGSEDFVSLGMSLDAVEESLGIAIILVCDEKPLLWVLTDSLEGTTDSLDRGLVSATRHQGLFESGRVPIVELTHPTVSVLVDPVISEDSLDEEVKR